MSKNKKKHILSLGGQIYNIITITDSIVTNYPLPGEYIGVEWVIKLEHKLKKDTYSNYTV